MAVHIQLLQKSAIVSNMTPKLLLVTILKCLDYCSKLYITSQLKSGNRRKTFPNVLMLIDEDAPNTKMTKNNTRGIGTLTVIRSKDGQQVNS